MTPAICKDGAIVPRAAVTVATVGGGDEAGLPDPARGEHPTAMSGSTPIRMTSVERITLAHHSAPNARLNG